MELVTSIQLINEGNILEYKLNNENTSYNLTNVSTHVGDEIYKLNKTEKDFVNNKFKIEYSGNKSSIIDNIAHNTAHYILLQEKENSRYLISVDSFRQLFTQIN